MRLRAVAEISGMTAEPVRALYQWKLNDSLIHVGRTRTLYIRNISHLDEGQLSYTVSTDGGSATSSTVRIGE